MKHLLVLAADEISADLAGRAAGEFFSWGAVALLILAFATPALINKNPVRRPGFSSSGRLAWRDLLFGMAPLHGLWPAVALDGSIAVLAAILPFAAGGGRPGPSPG